MVTRVPLMRRGMTAPAPLPPRQCIMRVPGPREQGAPGGTASTPSENTIIFYKSLEEATTRL